MLNINCPWCGLRDQTEFSYGGEAHIVRPKDPDALSDDEWGHYLFFRKVAQPHFSLTALVDVSYLMATLKPANVSVFNATLFAVVGAANAVPASMMSDRKKRPARTSPTPARYTAPRPSAT